MPGIVTNPTAGDVHINTPLTNFSQKYLQEQTAFQGLNAMPNLPVPKQSDLFYEFSRADFFRDEAQERADGTASQGGGFTLSDNPYFARVYAFHKDVTDRQRANQDSVIRLDMSATQFVTQKLMIRREAIFANTFIPAAGGVWGTEENANWLAGGDDPILTISAAQETIQGATGMRPNKLLLGRAAWNLLKNNDNILSRITGGATTAMPAQVMMQLVAQLFEIDRIFVMDGVVNSAVRGATESTAFITSDTAVLYFAPDGLSVDQPSAGAQFSWTGLTGSTSNGMRIKRFRWEETASDRIEGEMAFDYRITATELGHQFLTVGTA